MKKEITKGNSVLKHYFLMYFIVLIIPLVICCTYYIYMLFVINSDDIATRKKDLIHAAERFDTAASEVNYLGDCLTSDVEVNRFKKLTDVMEYPNTFKIYELQDSLPDLYLVNQAIYDYYIFFNNSNLVINKTIAYTYDQFYSIYLCPKSVGSYGNWETIFAKDNERNGFWPMERYNTYFNKKEANLIAYSRPLISTGVDSGGRVFIYIKEDVIESIMPTPEKGSIQTIQDFAGNIIYCKSPADTEINSEDLERIFADLGDNSGTLQKGIKINGKKHTLITYKSESSGMRYSYFVPREVINDRVMYCIFLLVVFIVVGVLVGVALSYHMSKKTATPINDILNHMSLKIEKFEGHQSALSSLKNTFNYLVDSNADLSQALNVQKPYLRTAFVNRLLYSGFQNDKDIARMADYLDSPLTNRNFCVLLFRFHYMTDFSNEGEQRLLSSFSASLTELIDKKIPGSLYTDLGDGQLALIINMEAAEPEIIKQKTKELVSEIKSEMVPAIAEKTFVYGGSIESDPIKIHDSYTNASYLCYNEAEQLENHIIWYDDRDSNSIGYPSSDMQVKLTHYVTTGDEKGLHDYLENLVNEYFMENDLPVYLQHMLINDLQTTLFRLFGIVKLKENEYADYYNKLEKNHNMPVISQITITLNLYRELCRFISDQKKAQDSDMIASGIVSYIDTHYGDPNLSLASVADEFNISQPYLSSLFKQMQGIKFSTYIENIRIDKAKDFLKTTDLPIGKISEMVGYGSANSFCRAFKRVTGLNTSEYRKD